MFRWLAPPTWHGGMGEVSLHRIHLLSFLLIPSTARSDPLIPTLDSMGLFSNYSPQQELHPVNPPLGIYPNFTAKQPTMLTLREHAFTFSGVGQISQVSILTTFTSGNRSDA